MKDQEINVAIAEECGWERIGVDGGFLMGVEPMDGLYVSLPDYCRSLNNMREAASIMSPEQKHAYAHRLNRMLGFSILDTGLACKFALIQSTARQRAEAFLRTIGKWVEA